MHTHNIHDKAKSISRYSTIKWQTTRLGSIKVTRKKKKWQSIDKRTTVE